MSSSHASQTVSEGSRCDDTLSHRIIGVNQLNQITSFWWVVYVLTGDPRAFARKDLSRSKALNVGVSIANCIRRKCFSSLSLSFVIISKLALKARTLQKRSATLNWSLHPNAQIHSRQLTAFDWQSFCFCIIKPPRLIETLFVHEATPLWIGSWRRLNMTNLIGRMKKASRLVEGVNESLNANGF